MDSHYANTVIEDIYKVTDIDYSSFEGKLSNLSKEYNGKLAVHQGAWTGVVCEFLSQSLISNAANEYTWKVIAKEHGTETVYNVKGKLENGNYILVSVSK